MAKYDKHIASTDVASTDFSAKAMDIKAHELRVVRAAFSLALLGSVGFAVSGVSAFIARLLF